MLRAFLYHGSDVVPIQRDARAGQLIAADVLQEALCDMHRTVDENISAARRKEILRYNSKTNEADPGFDIGDFVLVQCHWMRGHKLRFHWSGPRRISKSISAWVYQVEDLTGGKRESIRVRRKLRYLTNMDGTPL